MPLIDPVTMSASSTATPQTNATSPAILHPVAPLSTPLARTARHLAPAALAASFCGLFPRLVADPPGTLQLLLALTTVTQAVSCAVCFPVAGSARKVSRKPRPGEKAKRDAVAPGGIMSLATPTLLSLLLTILAVPGLHVALVLFGAPFLTHIPHTLLAAAHLAVLALFPLFYARGVDAGAWLAIGGARAPLDDTTGGLLGALLGAWLGAVPIPLDWDRDWQAWPVTIVAGMYAGYVLGRVAGGTVGFGWRFGGKAM